MVEGRKKKIITVVVAFGAVVLAAGAGAGLRWWQGRQNAPDPVQAVALSAQHKALRGDTDGALAEIDEALNNDNLDNEQKYELYFQKGNNYLVKKDYAKAIENYKIAEGYSKTDNLYSAMAQISRLQKDTDQAIKYYQEALKYVDASNPGAAQTREIIQFNIDSLQGKPLPEGAPGT